MCYCDTEIKPLLPLGQALKARLNTMLLKKHGTTDVMKVPYLQITRKEENSLFEKVLKRKLP
jgi:hypothetical protein